MGFDDIALSQREREQLERARQKLEVERVAILSQAVKVRMYFQALKNEGFSDEQAIELVKYSIGLLRG